MTRFCLSREQQRDVKSRKLKQPGNSFRGNEKLLSTDTIFREIMMTWERFINVPNPQFDGMLSEIKTMILVIHSHLTGPGRSTMTFV